MFTREKLEAVTAELRRLRATGAKDVAVSDQTLEQLRSALNQQRVTASRTAAATETRQVCGASVEKSSPLPASPAPKPVATARAEAPLTSSFVRPAEPVRKPAATSPAIPATAPAVTLPPGDKPTQWAALQEIVINDPVCRAHLRPGKKVVLGVGDLDASIFFCGEAPGAEEEIQGEPFVGPAGQLLTRMIQGMGLKREQVYIGNIMNWRPDLPVSEGGAQVGNRPPTAQEMNYCLPFLKAQLEIVQPKLIVALGATAAGGLLGVGSFKTLGEIKGRWHEFAGKPVMVTYHPSYILRNNSTRSKRGIWEDFLKVMERAGLTVSEKQRKFFL